MERLDFASIMAVVQKFLSETVDIEQIGLMQEMIWECLLDHPELTLDPGRVSKNLNGLSKIPDTVIKHYKKSEEQEKMAHRFDNRIDDLFLDADQMFLELKDLLRQDASISPKKKDGLLQKENGAFLAALLCFGWSRKFEKRDIRVPRLPEAAQLSPVVTDYILTEKVPVPCKWFQGRTKEIENLHRLLEKEGKVFLRGIPGIGKSELAKAYMKEYKKEYTNILYMNSSGDLQKDLANMDFADDRPGDDEEKRFHNHARFLKSLGEDTLLVVDNYNTPAEKDDFLDTLLRYRCRVLFTTRCRYEDQNCMDVEELSEEELLNVVHSFYQAANSGSVLSIIRLLYRHTLAVELAGKVLQQGMFNAQQLLKKLKKEGAVLRMKDKVSSIKDGRHKKDTYYGHLRILFSLYQLSPDQKKILTYMTMMPHAGIPARRFAWWTGLETLNDVNDLAELGLIETRSGSSILLYPMLREIAIADLQPSVISCRDLMSGLHAICLRQGEDIDNSKQFFEIIDNIMSTIKQDNLPAYLRFLEDAFTYMDKYGQQAGMKEAIRQIHEILEDESVGTVNDRALILDFETYMEPDENQCIALEKQAIRKLGQIDQPTAHLAANLHGNLAKYYYGQNNLELAKMHLWQSLELFKNYAPEGNRDLLIQAANYGYFLADLGETEKGYRILEKVAQFIQENNTDQCVDYADVQQRMAFLALAMKDREKAEMHFRKCLEIYTTIYADSPQKILEIQNEIRKNLGIPPLLG